MKLFRILRACFVLPFYGLRQKSRFYRLRKQLGVTHENEVAFRVWFVEMGSIAVTLTGASTVLCEQMRVSTRISTLTKLGQGLLEVDSLTESQLSECRTEFATMTSGKGIDLQRIAVWKSLNADLGEVLTLALQVGSSESLTERIAGHVNELRSRIGRTTGG